MTRLSPELHVCAVRPHVWAPESEPCGRGHWIHEVVNKHPELVLCLFDCGELVGPSVALQLGEDWLVVHLEKTICEHCQQLVGVCAVPDFGCGTPAYKEVVFAQDILDCPHCEQPLRRRLVLWRRPL